MTMQNQPSSENLPSNGRTSRNNENIGVRRGNRRPNQQVDLNRSFSNIANRMKSTFANTAPSDRKARPNFSNWTRVQLIDLLISEGHELRYESQISYSSLRESAEQLFLDRLIPEKSPPLSRNEIRKRNDKAQLIQNFWIHREYAQKNNRKLGILDRVPSGIFAVDSMSQHELSDIISTVEDEIDYASETFIGHYNGLYDDIAETPRADYAAQNRRSNSFGRTSIPEIKSTILQKHSSIRSVTEYLELADSLADNSLSFAAISELELDSPRATNTCPDLELGIPIVGADIPSTSINSIALNEAKKTIHFLDEPWTPPDWEKSLRYADFVQPRRQGGKHATSYTFWKTTTGRHCCLDLLGEQCDYFEEGQMSEFAVYGPGVTNYFKFIKWCIWLFFTLSIIVTVEIVINSNGEGYLYHRGLANLAITTVGNLDTTSQNSTYLVSLNVCRQYASNPANCELSKSQLGEIYSLIDIIVSFIVLLGFLWLRQFQFKEERDLDKNTLYASQYTVMVENLPPYATEKDVYHHFYSLLNQDSSAHEGFPIAAIHMSVGDEDDINECIARGELINTKKRLLNQHRFNCTVLRANYIDNSFLAEEEIRLSRFQFSKVCKDLDSKIKEKSDTIRKLNSAVGRNASITAFITFDHVIAANLLIQQFKNTSLFKYYLSDEHPFRIHGNLLKVSQAPEPSTIIWENLKYNKWNKFWRRTLTTFLALMLIFISIAITFGSKAFQLKFAVSSEPGSSCTIAFQQLPQSEQRARVASDSSLTNCYCQQSDDTFSTYDPYCKEYVKNRLNQQVFTFFASIAVLLINATLDQVLKLFSIFEKHFTENTKENYTLIRVFFLKYINTAGVFLINNNSTILNNIFKVNPSSSLEFSAEWYSSIGVIVLLVQLGDIFFCHVFKAMRFYLYKRKLRIARENLENNFHGNKSLVFTQEELNEMQKGPSFELAYRYAQLLSTIFVCLTFASGMPVLYIIAGLNFLVFYSVEKFLFINLYRIPPRFNTHMNKTAADLIPLAVFLHLGMAIWVLSNKEFFTNSSPTSSSDSVLLSGTTSAMNSKSLSEKVSQTHTFPLYIFALTLGAMIALQGFFRGPLHTVLRIIKGFLIKPEYGADDDGCGCISIQEQRFESLVEQKVQLVTFRNAMKRNLIKGLGTYNILQNPEYKQAFAISWKFAVEHHHIKSLTLAKATIDDEDDLDQAQNISQNKYANGYSVPLSPSPISQLTPHTVGNPKADGVQSSFQKFFPETAGAAKLPKKEISPSPSKSTDSSSNSSRRISKEVQMRDLYKTSTNGEAIADVRNVAKTDGKISRTPIPGTSADKKSQEKSNSSSKKSSRSRVTISSDGPKVTLILPKLPLLLSSILNQEQDSSSKPLMNSKVQVPPAPVLKLLNTGAASANSPPKPSPLDYNPLAPPSFDTEDPSQIADNDYDSDSYFDEPPPPYQSPTRRGEAVTSHFPEKETKISTSISNSAEQDKGSGKLAKDSIQVQIAPGKEGIKHGAEESAHKSVDSVNSQSRSRPEDLKSSSRGRAETSNRADKDVPTLIMEYKETEKGVSSDSQALVQSKDSKSNLKVNREKDTPARTKERSQSGKEDNMHKSLDSFDIKSRRKLKGDGISKKDKKLTSFDTFQSLDVDQDDTEIDKDKTISKPPLSKSKPQLHIEIPSANVGANTDSIPTKSKQKKTSSHKDRPSDSGVSAQPLSPDCPPSYESSAVNKNEHPAHTHGTKSKDHKHHHDKTSGIAFKDQLKIDIPQSETITGHKPRKNSLPPSPQRIAHAPSHTGRGDRHAASPRPGDRTPSPQVKDATRGGESKADNRGILGRVFAGTNNNSRGSDYIKRQGLLLNEFDDDDELFQNNK